MNLSPEDFSTFEEPVTGVYNEMLFKEEAYQIIKCCFEVHKEPGKGFTEVVYKDALCIEFDLNNIPFTREKLFDISYKNFILPRKYRCDFLVFDKIILEVKAQTCLTASNAGQLLNYLTVTKRRLGLLVNFGESSLKFKRVIL